MPCLLCLWGQPSSKQQQQHNRTAAARLFNMESHALGELLLKAVDAGLIDRFCFSIGVLGHLPTPATHW
jgi:hypothetical protein